MHERHVAHLQVISVAQLQHLIRLRLWLPPEQEAQVLPVRLQGMLLFIAIAMTIGTAWASWCLSLAGLTEARKCCGRQAG